VRPLRDGGAGVCLSDAGLEAERAKVAAAAQAAGLVQP
jgi:hypothetical protein